MLPLQQALEVRQSILEYLKATYTFKSREVHEAFYRFIENPTDGIFKGPYVSLKLPFEGADEGIPVPIEIAPSFLPYKHQLQAFHRLHSTGNHKPEPTLLTTGTGSGKTESFLYPILDHCYRNRHKRGIKVIILYPMNALATDQARRLAGAIFNDPKLNGTVTAGLFIGEGRDKKQYPVAMGEANVIENRDEIVANPPDILLTNFKMLDYGLMGHRYHSLWVHNFEDPTLLQYLVLDELHTYDGAQGTDVANLIRRLKLKLEVPEGQLCPVGTSATLGSGEDSVELLTNYASDVFGQEFPPESVITEHRLNTDDFFVRPEVELDPFIPRVVGLRQSRMGLNEQYSGYIARQKKLWQLPEDMDPLTLGHELLKLKVVKHLVSICSNQITAIPDLVIRLAELNPAFAQLPEEEDGIRLREELIASILALMAEAKADKGLLTPFLYIQVQLWVREMSGLLREFDVRPSFTWRDKLAGSREKAALPPYFCRECGASGWLANKHDNRNQFERDPLEVYNHYFSNHKNIYLVNTDMEDHVPVDEYSATTSFRTFVHSTDLRFNDQPGEDRVAVIANRKVRDNKNQHICPECNTENTISIIGTRVATLNSISVSQILSSDLDSRNEQYRKVLAFTNAVQDAAHQAGFVEARNYRFTFRTSLQKVINILGRPIDPLVLADEFIKYWKTHADPAGNSHLEAYYYRFFPSDLIGKAEVEEYRSQATGRFSPQFEQEFDARIQWEILSEFGYNATIGRTLEKSGSSAVGFKQDELEAVFANMYLWLEENLLGQIDKGAFVRFLNSVMHRLRIRGAVDHLYLHKFRTGDLKLWDLNWMKDKRHFLNKRFGERTRLPKLACTIPHTRSLLDTTFTQSENWFHRYFRKSFPLMTQHQAVVNDFYKELFAVMESQGLLIAADSKEGRNYALSPGSMAVSNKVAHFSCTQCTSTMHVLQDDALLDGAACQNYRCSGVYERRPGNELNYYNMVYNRSTSPRIHATEHTGLLERHTREQIELDFKERPLFKSLNTLVATSTLEMGIDVGTLNTAINTAVPPMPANFLQRVGRAGRSSGAALIQNFARNEPHDLFYYAEPLEMMDGDIHTPGCFLNARDILGRHFTAFCIDSWVKDDPERHQIPGTIGSLNLTTTKTTDTGFFINDLVAYVFSNRDTLIARFRSMYDERVDTTLHDDLRETVTNGLFGVKLLRVFEVLREELLHLVTKDSEITGHIKEKHLGANDTERKALEDERRSLRQLRKLIERRLVVEHLTNTGILPNYAFPETGVTLSASVYGFRPEGAEQEPQAKSYEVVRGASQALREFAPDNLFYSQGYKLVIGGLNTSGWHTHGELRTMRFCSNCDHIEDDVTAPKGNCPKCGNASWGSASNIHRFAQMTSVKSFNWRERAALNDAREDREQLFYRISKHFRFNPNTVEGTFGMTEIPFGIEYVRDVTLTEVNLGTGEPHANHITINGQEDIARHGFVTCRSCGKSTSKPNLIQAVRANNRTDLSFHYGYCKHRERDYIGETGDVFEEVFLYRQLHTEAMKILLPVQEFLNEATQQMFKAGLELGFKRYYRGNPDHLRLEFYSEFNTATDRFDRYIVAYDTVPGGTGYLRKLFSTDEFTRLLQESYHAIRDCNCQHLGKDGCYRCILSYGNQHTRDDLSRQSAEQLFARIVGSAQHWEPIHQGISSLTKTGQIEESELEFKFIYALRKYADAYPEKGLVFSEVKVDGITHYLLEMPTKDGRVIYSIRPQVNLGQAQGVAIDTRCDYLIKCTGMERNGEKVEDINELLKFKDVAIYLDGYTYHASEKHLRFYDDIQVRNAIAASERLVCWSLSWNDVLRIETEREESQYDSFHPRQPRYSKTINDLRRIPITNDLDLGLLKAKNSVERLLWLLANGNSEHLIAEIGMMFAAFQERVGAVTVSSESALALTDVNRQLTEDDRVHPSAEAYMLSALSLSNELYKVRLLVNFSTLHVLAGLSVFDQGTIEKSTWEEFLQLYCLVNLSGYESL